VDERLWATGTSLSKEYRGPAVTGLETSRNSAGLKNKRSTPKDLKMEESGKLDGIFQVLFAIPR
jgi:hypothetical protein